MLKNLLIFVLISFIFFSFKGMAKEESLDNIEKTQQIDNTVNKPLLVVQTGHSSPILAVDFSPDGKYVVSGGGSNHRNYGSDNSVKLWEMASGKLIRTFTGHSFPVNSVSFSPNGKYIASVGTDYKGGGEIKFWDITTGKEIYNFQGHSPPYGTGFSSMINVMAFSPDGKYIISGAADKKTLKLWDVITGNEIRTFSHWAKTVDFSPNGKYIISGSSKILKLWEVTTGKEIYTFQGHSSRIHTVKFSPNGRYVASGGYKEIKLWDILKGKEIGSFDGHSFSVYSVSFSPDGKYLVSAGGSIHTPGRTELKLWNVRDRKEIGNFYGHRLSVNTVSFSPNGKYFVSGSSDSTLKLWEIKNRQITRTFFEHSNSVSDVIFSPDGKYFVSGSKDKTLKLWNKISGKVVHTFIGHSTPIEAIDFSPNGKYIVSGGGNYNNGKGELKLWSVISGKEILDFHENSGVIKDVSFSPDGKYIISGGGRKHDRLSELKLWEVNTGKVVHIFPSNRHRETINAISFSPNGKYIGCGGSGETLELWDVLNRKKIRTFDNSDWIQSLDFSPDGKHIIISNFYSGNGHLTLWNVESGKKIRDYYDDHTIHSVNFSPDGKKFVTASGGLRSDNVIKLWDIKKRKAIRIFTGHSEKVNAANFSPDGRHIISGSSDKTIKLWETANTNTVRTFKGDSSQVGAVDFSPDGKSLISGHGNGTVRIWEMKNGKSLQLDAGSSTGSSNYYDPGIYAINFSPNGEYFATKQGQPGLGGELKLWKAKTKKVIRTFNDYSRHVNVMAFSPDSTYMAVGDDGRFGMLYLWDIETGKVSYSVLVGNYLASYEISAISFSPDGKYLVMAGGVNLAKGDVLKLWSKNLKEIRTFRGYGTDAIGAIQNVRTVDFSPDGKYIVGGSSFNQGVSGSVSLWNVITGEIKAVSVFNTDVTVNATNFSPDGKYIAFASLGFYSNNLKLCEIVSVFEKESSLNSIFTKKICEIHNLKGHSNSVNTVSFSPNSKYLVSGGDDTQMKIWNVVTGEEMASIISLLNSNDYIIYTPESYYMSTKNGYDAVAVRVGINGYSFEQFDLRLNRPDLVLKNLPNSDPTLIDAYYKAYQKRLEKMDFQEEMLKDDFHVPEIDILNENELPISTTKKQITFKTKASDSQYPLDRINIWVNDVPVYGMKGISVRTEKTQKDIRDIPLTLSAGDNKIQVSVLNQSGAESLKATKYIFYEGQPVKPDLHIIAIGVSQYQNAKKNLEYATKDATDLAKLFQHRNDLFENVFVNIILDQEVNWKNLSILKQRLMQTKVDDRVIFFFAGHGLLDNNYDYYLSTYDVDFTNPSQKGLAYEKLEELLDGIPARYKLMFIDACHSGEVDKEEIKLVESKNIEHGKLTFRSFGQKVTQKTVGLNNSFELMKQLFIDLRRRSGTTVVSSAGGAEYALEGSEWQNGVFSYCLLSGLKNQLADSNQDNKVMVSELQQHLLQCVPQLTEDKQQPTFRAENLTLDFQIW